MAASTQNSLSVPAPRLPCGLIPSPNLPAVLPVQHLVQQLSSNSTELLTKNHELLIKVNITIYKNIEIELTIILTPHNSSAE